MSLEEHEEAAASIVISARSSDLAQALGKVVGHALQEVGFGNVAVTHSDEEGVEPLEQTDLEQGKSLLEAIADANPDTFRGPIAIHSFGLGDETDLLPPEESAHLAEIIAEDDED
jgi:hypothetical protein